MDVEEFLKKIPRPSVEDIPELYRELDEMTRRIAEILTASLQRRDPGGGFRKGHLGRPRGVDKQRPGGHGALLRHDHRPFPQGAQATRAGGVYSLRRARDCEKLRPLAELARSLLAHPLRLETVLYKFYNWEEHQRRHWRGRRAENEVCGVVKARRGDAVKYVLLCGGKRREIDCAVPQGKPVVAINIRVGVEEDRAKRIKEFAAELKEVKECGIKYFIVAYLVPEHEKGKLEEIRAEFLKEAPFDLVVLMREELGLLAERLRE